MRLVQMVTAQAKLIKKLKEELIKKKYENIELRKQQEDALLERNQLFLKVWDVL